MFGLSLLIHCDFPGIQGFGGSGVVVDTGFAFGFVVNSRAVVVGTIGPGDLGEGVTEGP
jgi:hypothetical protein